MTGRTSAALLITAAITSVYALITFAAGMWPDFKWSTIVAVLCLGAVFAIDYVSRERHARNRQIRDDVWDRRLTRRWP